MGTHKSPYEDFFVAFWESSLTLTNIGIALFHQSKSFILASQVSLELGGNAPCIVFDDADIDVAVKGTVSYNLQIYLYL